MALDLTPYEPAIIAAQRATLTRQYAEAQSRIALTLAGRGPAALKAEEDRILAELDAILSAPVAMVPQPVQQQQAHAGKVNGVKSTPRGGYIVHRRGDSSQKLMTPPHRLVFEHTTLEAAQAEAERLAARHKREFAIFQEVGAALPPAAEAAQQNEAA